MINSLPNSWNDITVTTYQELKLLEQDKDNYTDFNYIIEQISILLDIDSEDEFFDDLDFDDLLEIINNLKWLRKEPKYSINNIINNKILLELNNIKTGQFLDLNHYFSIDYIQNLHIIAAILYKKYKYDEWGNIITEPYIYDITERSKEFLNIPISQIYNLIDYFLDWKNNIDNVYKDIFKKNDDNDIEINDEELTGMELAIYKKEQIEEQNLSSWGWEAILWQYSNNDITKYDDLFNTNIILLLNTIAFKASLNI